MKVAVFGSSSCKQGSDEYTEAEHLGLKLAEGGIDVVTGGYSGTMEAVSKGASGVPGIEVCSDFCKYLILGGGSRSTDIVPESPPQGERVSQSCNCCFESHGETYSAG